MQSQGTYLLPTAGQQPTAVSQQQSETQQSILSRVINHPVTLTVAGIGVSIFSAWAIRSTVNYFSSNPIDASLFKESLFIRTYEAEGFKAKHELLQVSLKSSVELMDMVKEAFKGKDYNSLIAEDPFWLSTEGLLVLMNLKEILPRVEMNSTEITDLHQGLLRLLNSCMDVNYGSNPKVPDSIYDTLKEAAQKESQLEAFVLLIKNAREFLSKYTGISSE